jgi:hypothetical protein
MSMWPAGPLVCPFAFARSEEWVTGLWRNFVAAIGRAGEAVQMGLPFNNIGRRLLSGEGIKRRERRKVI